MLPLAGRFTLGSFAEHLAALSLFAASRPSARSPSSYRTWAYESAALDLALRQAHTTLHAALAREPRPVRFVVSLRLGEPPSLDPVRSRLELYPGLRFKLDPTSSWDEALIAALRATGAVDSVDFKGYYVGSIVDQPADAVLYRRVAEAFTDAWIEDPALTAGDRRRARAPPRALLLGCADPLDRRHPRRCPTRRAWSTSSPPAWAGCAACSTPMTTARSRESATTAAGSSSWASAAGQIQYLASLFHADAPNDVAPSGFNLPVTPAGLPSSPLPASPFGRGLPLGLTR